MKRFHRVAIAAALVATTTLLPATAHADERDYGAAYKIFSCSTYWYPWCRH